MSDFWAWLMDQSRYETWPHIVAIMIGIFIGGALRVAYIQPWFDQAWPRRTRGARIVAGIGIAWVAIMAFGLASALVFESGLID